VKKRAKDKFSEWQMTGEIRRFTWTANCSVQRQKDERLTPKQFT
jgi:hypothetical protein